LGTKIKLLAAYRGLIARNSALKRPRSAVKLPAIIIGFNTNISGISNASLDGRILEIHSSENPMFYSPMDILDRLRVGLEYRREFFRQYPVLLPMEGLVFGE
jgi:hypothetical protein